MEFEGGLDRSEEVAVKEIAGGPTVCVISQFFRDTVGPHSYDFHLLRR